jgi:hypothetical protein
MLCVHFNHFAYFTVVLQVADWIRHSHSVDWLRVADISDGHNDVHVICCNDLYPFTLYKKNYHHMIGRPCCGPVEEMLHVRVEVVTGTLLWV